MIADQGVELVLDDVLDSGASGRLVVSRRRVHSHRADGATAANLTVRLEPARSGGILQVVSALKSLIGSRDRWWATVLILGGIGALATVLEATVYNKGSATDAVAVGVIGFFADGLIYGTVINFVVAAFPDRRPASP